MPFLVTLEEEHMPALTLHWPGLHVLQIDTLAHVKTKRGMKVQWTSPDLHLDGVAPAHQSVALDETVGDEVLVLECNPGVFHEPEDSSVIDEHLTVARRTLNALGRPFVHYLHSEVLRPAVRAVQVPALQPRHGL